jgi:hypothetical protein
MTLWNSGVLHYCVLDVLSELFLVCVDFVRVFSVSFLFCTLGAGTDIISDDSLIGGKD